MTHGGIINRDNLRRAAWGGLVRLARSLGVACPSLDTWPTRRLLVDRVLASIDRTRTEHRRAMAAEAFE